MTEQALAAGNLSSGIGVLFTGWPIYHVLVCGLLEFLLNQNTFRVGVAPEPVLALAVITLGVLFAGVTILSKRAPQAAVAEQRAY